MHRDLIYFHLCPQNDLMLCGCACWLEENIPHFLPPHSTCATSHLTNMSLFFNFKVFGPTLFWHTLAAVMNSACTCFLSYCVGQKTVRGDEKWSSMYNLRPSPSTFLVSLRTVAGVGMMLETTFKSSPPLPQTSHHFVYIWDVQKVKVQMQ